MSWHSGQKFITLQVTFIQVRSDIDEFSSILSQRFSVNLKCVLSAVITSCRSFKFSVAKKEILLNFPIFTMVILLYAALIIIQK